MSPDELGLRPEPVEGQSKASSATFRAPEEMGPEGFDSSHEDTGREPVEGQSRNRRVSRRGLLGAAGAGVVGVGIGAAVVGLADRSSENIAGQPAPTSTSYPFYGDH